jgi:hypothetical protein
LIYFRRYSKTFTQVFTKHEKSGSMYDVGSKTDWLEYKERERLIKCVTNGKRPRYIIRKVSFL